MPLASYKKNIPVLLIAYNRPSKFKKLVFELKLTKPKKIYVFVDGPRSKKDQLMIDKTKDVLNKINWKCQIIKKFEDKNHGVGVGPYNAINWFFQNEEMGIILEDDCIPQKNFFYFCKKMLIAHRNNNNIGIICGTNFVPIKTIKSSYLFSIFPNIWGWATWKRNWKGYNLDLKYWKNFRTSKKWINICLNFDMYKTFTSMIDYYFFNKKKLWDVQYFIFLLKKNKINILPKYSIIKNIGIDKFASTTFKKSKKISYVSKKFDLKLIHPKTVSTNKKIDERIFYSVYYKKKGIIKEFFKNIKFYLICYYRKFIIKF
jgi:hypothetical protein